MATLKENIKEELIKRLTESDFKPITITMKYDKASITITPCYYEDIPTIDNIEAYLVNCTSCDTPYCENIDELTDFIANYKTIKEQWIASAKACYNKYLSLKKYSMKEIRANVKLNYEYSLYSDLHEIVFKYRPNGINFNPHNTYNCNSMIENMVNISNFDIDPHLYEISCEEYYHA